MVIHFTVIIVVRINASSIYQCFGVLKTFGNAVFRETPRSCISRAFLLRQAGRKDAKNNKNVRYAKPCVQTGWIQLSRSTGILTY